jgi:glucose/arabinose dehydrogenase
MRFSFVPCIVLAAVVGGAACGDSNSGGGTGTPVATISTPQAGATYHGGVTIQFSGSATDADGNPLPESALSWWAEFHHDTHTHPFVPVTAGGSGQAQVPTAGEVSSNVFYRFYLRAVDHGVADTVYQDVIPEKADLTLTTVPAGLGITLDGQPHPAPFTVTGVVGIDREIGTPSPQSTIDSSYTFVAWSDAGTRIHIVSTPASNTTYTATFVGSGPPNQPPTAAITAPAANASLPVNVAVQVTATANDPDGTILGVQFFDGATSIGTVNTSPYSVTWTPTTTGVHSLTAKATDNGNAVGTSPAVNVTVTGGGGDTQAPTVTLTAPTDGTPNLVGVVTATATATDNVGVVGVTFQLDGVTVGEDLTAPYSMALPSLATYTTGPHQVRARARDAAGNQSPWAVAHITSGGNVNLPSTFNSSSLVTNIGATGTAMAFAPDGRLFICTQDGLLQVVKNNALTGTPFVQVNTVADGERGLLGVAFHPQFPTDRRVYVYYTVGTGATAHNRISYFLADANNPDVAQAGSEHPIVDLPTLSGATSHNGGALHFGPDGKLYVAVGDNTLGSNAQDSTTRLGKILRYNDDGTIPADNPSIGTGVNKAIWALGLRNPFTFGFQPGTGRLFINDVGEMTWEEINEGAAGANYGWPDTEGATNNPAYTSPVFTYHHVSGGDPTRVVGDAIVGSAFYNPGTVKFPPEYVGSYFFADYVSRWINRLDLPNGNDAVYAFARLPDGVTDLAVGPDGMLYALAIQPNGSWGVTRFTH